MTAAVDTIYRGPPTAPAPRPGCPKSAPAADVSGHLRRAGPLGPPWPPRWPVLPFSKCWSPSGDRPAPPITTTFVAAAKRPLPHGGWSSSPGPPAGVLHQEPVGRWRARTHRRHRRAAAPGQPVGLPGPRPVTGRAHSLTGVVPNYHRTTAATAPQVQRPRPALRRVSRPAGLAIYGNVRHRQLRAAGMSAPRPPAGHIDGDRQNFAGRLPGAVPQIIKPISSWTENSLVSAPVSHNARGPISTNGPSPTIPTSTTNTEIHQFSATRTSGDRVNDSREPRAAAVAPSASTLPRPPPQRPAHRATVLGPCRFHQTFSGSPHSPRVLRQDRHKGSNFNLNRPIRVRPTRFPP